MSQQQIQEFIVQEIKVNRMSRPKKGFTIQGRDQKSLNHWVNFLVERGYTESEASIIFNDAKDMAILELASA